MDAPADWWRTFFSGTAVDFWLGATTVELTRQEAEFLLDSLRIDPPAKILDVPCGGGRHSRELAGRGYNLIGVDISTDFLAAARSHPVLGSGSVAWEQREMRNLPWSGEFDGAFCFGNSFGYDTDDGNADFLRSVARAVRPGARFVLDTGYVTECLLPNFQERSWYEIGGIHILSRRRYDPAGGRLHVEFTFVREGKVEVQSMSARLYSYREIVRLLEEAGFAEIQGYGSLAKEPFRLGSNRLLLVATKA